AGDAGLSVHHLGKDEWPDREGLFIAESTVKTYVGSIFLKLGVSTRTEAAIVGWDVPDVAITSRQAVRRFGGPDPEGRMGGRGGLSDRLSRLAGSPRTPALPQVG